MNNEGKIRISQLILLILAFLVVFLLGGLIVLKIKDKDNSKNTIVVNKEENNYVEEYDTIKLLNTFKDISYNENTSFDNVTLYGLESLSIDKIEVSDGRIKYYSKNIEYTDTNLYGVKYIEIAGDNKTYTEILVYTSYGIYYYNTNGNVKIINEELRNEYFKDSKENALYTKTDDTLNLKYIKLTNTWYVNGISTKKSIDENYTYFVVNNSNDNYLLDYTKTESNGIEMITSVKLGDKLSNIDYIYEIGKDKKLYLNYDLSLMDENKDLLIYEEEIIKPNKVFLTKDAYYFLTNDNNLYELLLKDFNINKIKKYGSETIEKVSLDEEKTYQGDKIKSVKQYIKIEYIDGNIEEIL